MLLLMSAFVALTAQSWLGSGSDGSWTDRLGLYFRDDCQEDAGITGLVAWVVAWVTRRGQQRNGHCESKEMRCPSGSRVTGLQVRYARIEDGDRDLYDFRPRCGTAWQAWLGLKFPESKADLKETEADICPGSSGSSSSGIMTGVQVMRGRNERKDQDFYNFKLRCGKRWAHLPLGLPFDGLRETRTATCASGSSIAGFRVHRGFQDWGDVDTYEFQLVRTFSHVLPAPDAESRSHKQLSQSRCARRCASLMQYSCVRARARRIWIAVLRRFGRTRCQPVEQLW